MLELFDEYKDQSRINDALIVGRNLANRYPGNEEIFQAYFDYLCMLARELPSLEDRQNFAQQANVALAFFSENVSMTKEAVELIGKSQVSLNEILGRIGQSVAEKKKTELDVVVRHNGEMLKALYDSKDALYRSTSQEMMEEVLKGISRLDGEIKKSQLTDEQTTIYDALTKEVTSVISDKMREFERQNQIAYNKEAADAYAKAFDEFRKNESKYKVKAQLFALVSKTLFAYDVAKLFNETMIYYNHVYSYIFSKLDDSGKLALTRYSIECERNLR